MSNLINATVEILGKTYSIKCPEEEVEALEAAAQIVHEKMLEIQTANKNLSLERVSILSNLNIAYKLLQTETEKNKMLMTITAQINGIQSKLDVVTPKLSQADLLYSE